MLLSKVNEILSIGFMTGLCLFTEELQAGFSG